MIALPKNVSSRRAAGILQRVFDRVETGCAFRLWDGTLVELGHGAPVCTAVVHRPETFVRLMSDPTPLNFAEAYVEGALDIEGDLFAGMKVADALEEIRLPLRERLRLYVELWRS
jgi:cyclopropane-fatty-acyl-phospholipid synthase